MHQLVAMIQEAEDSSVFTPLAIIASSLSTPDVIQALTETYRNIIPGNVVDYITLTTTNLGLNKYKIQIEEAHPCVDDEGYIIYRTFSLIVVLLFVPTLCRERLG